MTKPNKKSVIGGGIKNLGLGRPLRVGGDNIPGQGTSPPTPGESLAINESGSRLDRDRVKIKPGQVMTLSEQSDTLENTTIQDQKMTGSKLDPVTGAESDTVNLEPGHNFTGSGNNPVKSEPGQNMTLSVQSGISEKTGGIKSRKMRDVFKSGTLKLKDNFCGIPISVVSQPAMFESASDFQVYLYLYAKSYGYGRNTCDMGITELMSFTGMSKNSVRKTIESLTAGKWIHMLQDFECARITRKWRVYSPYENGKTDKPTHIDPDAYPQINVHEAFSGDMADCNRPVCDNTGSAYDPVKSEPGQNLIQGGSSRDPVTGSNFDPYKNKELNNYKNSSLSACAEAITSYFASAMPFRKRESELQAYEELKSNYSDQDIADCLEFIRRAPLPGGESCHSPMAYLAKAMNEVFAKVNDRRNQEKRRAELASYHAEEARRQSEEYTREKARIHHETELQNHAFSQFVGSRNETQVITEICRQHRLPVLDGQIGKAIAVAHWWNALPAEERQQRVGVV
ncbi:MAG: hypothetical protein HQK54_11505 [Oligoflexales bacterium]|nr:hypothetical protein [Oligoflexales bacterium]